VDFLAFSLHKMAGPRGVGGLSAKPAGVGRGGQAWEAGPDLLEPALLGGGTVSDTTYGDYGLLEAPERFEAGIPNYPGMIAAGTAVEYLSRRMDRIARNEAQLTGCLTRICWTVTTSGWFEILGPQEARSGGIPPFR
jgi:cysteine desulfurase/selenocysteine lyase